MSKISDAQILEETISGLNFLSFATERNNYDGGIIGPALASIFVIAGITQQHLKANGQWENLKTNHLKDFQNLWKSESKKFYDGDKTILDCIRNSVSHNRYSFQEDSILFKTDRCGSIAIPYEKMAILSNQVVKIFNETHRYPI